MRMSGRLSPEQMQPIEQARQERSTAVQEVNRTKLRLQQAQQEADMAKADEAAAKADATRSDAMAKAANESREPQSMQQASHLREAADLHQKQAQAHTEYAKKLVDARKAAVAAAEQRQKLAENQMEWSKLEALQQANIPAATKYDPGKLQTGVNDDRKELSQREQKAHQLEGDAMTAYRTYQDARQQFQARAGSPGSSPATMGTGSSGAFQQQPSQPVPPPPQPGTYGQPSSSGTYGQQPNPYGQPSQPTQPSAPPGGSYQPPGTWNPPAGGTSQ